MPIRVSCPCGKLLQVKDELAGRKVKCPACGDPLVVPNSKDDEDSSADPRDLEDDSSGNDESPALPSVRHRDVLVIYAAVFLAGLAFAWWMQAGLGGFLFMLPITFVFIGLLMLIREGRRRENLRLNRLLTEPKLGLELFRVFRPADTFVSPDPIRAINFTPRKRVTIDGADVALLDYEYHIRRHKMPPLPVIQTIAVLHRPGTHIPNILIRPKGRGLETDLGALLFGGTDITFKSHPDFSRNYLLHGIDEAGIRKSFNSEVLDFFEQHRDLIVEVTAQRMLYCRKGIVVEQHEINDFIHESIRLLKLLREDSRHANPR